MQGSPITTGSFVPHTAVFTKIQREEGRVSVTKKMTHAPGPASLTPAVPRGVTLVCGGPEQRKVWPKSLPFQRRESDLTADIPAGIPD